MVENVLDAKLGLEESRNADDIVKVRTEASVLGKVIKITRNERLSTKRISITRPLNNRLMEVGHEQLWFVLVPHETPTVAMHRERARRRVQD